MNLMIARLAAAALVSLIALPALAVHHPAMSGLETHLPIPGGVTACAIETLRPGSLGPFLSGLI